MRVYCTTSGELARVGWVSCAHEVAAVIRVAAATIPITYPAFILASDSGPTSPILSDNKDYYQQGQRLSNQRASCWPLAQAVAADLTAIFRA